MKLRQDMESVGGGVVRPWGLVDTRPMRVGHLDAEFWRDGWSSLTQVKRIIVQHLGVDEDELTSYIESHVPSGRERVSRATRSKDPLAATPVDEGPGRP